MKMSVLELMLVANLQQVVGVTSIVAVTSVAEIFAVIREISNDVTPVVEVESTFGEFSFVYVLSTTVSKSVIDETSSVLN